MTQYNLENDYGLTVIYDCLEKIKKLKDANKVRKAMPLTTQKFDALIAKLHELKLIANLSNMPVITSTLITVTPKGEEFMKRFKLLMQLLNGDPECPNLKC
ncbi:MAG: hypothetical protein QW734_05525 [Candidatus Bathyarchaeia archaeon]